MLADNSRSVLTLDAGGTKFSFSAVAGGKEIVDPVTYPSHASDLDTCLATIIQGFSEINSCLQQKPVAISFAFPGPSYYPEGVIGNLGNLPAFRGGVPLGPILQEKFQIPVFINNDGDLFALGEALYGLLPMVNEKLAQSGSSKRFRNLTGFTLGTGLGGGITHDGRLYTGDNSSAGEVWLLRNSNYPYTIIEESVSIRALLRTYATESGNTEGLGAKEIYHVALGEMAGNKPAALNAFKTMGHALGECIRNVLTITDSLIVLGGGLSGSYKLFSPAMFQALRKPAQNYDQSKEIPGLEISCFNLEDENELALFLKGTTQTIAIPNTNKCIELDVLKRTGIGLSVLGTSKAVSLGAWAYALGVLDKK